MKVLSAKETKRHGEVKVRARDWQEVGKFFNLNRMVKKDLIKRVI